MVVSVSSHRRRLTGITHESASVLGGTSVKRVEAIRAGRAEVTEELLSLQAFRKALDLFASIEMCLNLVSHGSLIFWPFHSSKTVAVVLPILPGMGRGCILSRHGSSGIFGV